MKRLTSKYLSAQLFVFLCLFAFASLILCYVVFGDHREAIEMEELKRINRSLMHEYYETHKHNLKNILMWTHNFTEPFVFFRMGRENFINAGCQYNNCNITNDKSYFDDVTEWDALLFHAPEYTRKGNSWNHPSPKARKSDQVYTLVSIESSGNYPICEERWDDYFNWTMTYMLDSDVPWEYFVIRDRKTNKIVGPARDMKWADNMAGVSEEVKNGLKNKTKAVAWFVSNCRTISKREDYVKELEVEMKKLGLVLDIYGKCGKLSCEEAACYEKLRDDYMFYLSFENSFSTDYVTEKLLTAMQNDVVPIVWGGGNYSRFAPPDSYIDARKHSPQELAALIQELTKDIELYSKFFNWRQYYSYHGVMESYESHPLCRLCKALNEPSNPRVKKNIASWWNGENSC